jgi:hypothetical protein
MPDPVAHLARLQGYDATHRASNIDTHLTHGCIPLFRQFSRVRQGCAGFLGSRNRAIASFFEGAPRTLGEAVA